MEETKPLREVAWRSASEDNMSVVGRKEKKVGGLHPLWLLWDNIKIMGCVTMPYLF